MNLKNNFKLLLSAPLLLIAAIGFCPNLYAQNTNQPVKTTETQKDEDVQDGDVVITANITARELKFEVVPSPTVIFPAEKNRKNVWEAERVNLPQTVEPGVTYRNVGIRLRIVSRLADIERIVAEALGEIPVGGDETPRQEKDALPAAPPKQQRPAGTPPKN
jgi:hypothetical protein